MNKKGFTLIELITCLVILSIVSLIVTPIIINIIKDSKIASYRRSVDGYGKALELAVANYRLETGHKPTDLTILDIKYSGHNINCDIMQLKLNGGVYLSKCLVNDKEVRDSSTTDGWYHYGTRDLTEQEYVDLYGDALEEASLKYLNSTGNLVENYRDLKLDYTGKKFFCSTKILFDGTVYLTKCRSGKNYVKDESTSDGYYHYGSEITTKEGYVDAYGKLLEKASTDYYNKNGSKVADYRTLETGYNLKEISCNTHLNYDGTIYLTKCKVAGYDVLDSSTDDGYYHYGTNYKAYTKGNTITYDGMEFYVLANSTVNQDTVTLLKATPFTADESNKYAAGRTYLYGHYTSSCSTPVAYNNNGAIAYYSTSTCGFSKSTSCTSAYSSSNIKYAVDNWINDRFDKEYIKEARLITLNELTSFGFSYQSSSSSYNRNYSTTPSWITQYPYWTMTGVGSNKVWGIYNGTISQKVIYGERRCNYIACSGCYIVGESILKIRPVIVLKKRAL